jgi:hypothetical protein
VNIEGFPAGISFRPHGTFLFKNETLFVVNHGVDKGGERVEVIKVDDMGAEQPKFTHVRGYSLDSPNNLVNDVAAISETEFYITHCLT